MTEDPVDLDGRRSVEGQMATDFRRHAARSRVSDQSDRSARQKRDAELCAEMLAGPAENWTEVAARAEFLIRHYARTPEAQDARLRKLILRALGDIARLTKREERNR